MQRLWLGDALDFWKSTFIDVLRASSSESRAVKVVPMFTDTGWTTAELDTYVSILGVAPGSTLTTAQVTKTNREHYFAPCTRLSDDVFVDPDTGIATAKPTPSHVAPAEIFQMLSDDNVVATYQHRPQRVAAGWLARYVQLVADTRARTVGYESGQVGMVFATMSPVREAALRQSLVRRLGAVAIARGTIPGRVL